MEKSQIEKPQIGRPACIWYLIFGIKIQIVNYLKIWFFCRFSNSLIWFSLNFWGGSFDIWSYFLSPFLFGCNLQWCYWTSVLTWRRRREWWVKRNLDHVTFELVVSHNLVDVHNKARMPNLLGNPLPATTPKFFSHLRKWNWAKGSQLSWLSQKRIISRKLLN